MRAGLLTKKIHLLRPITICSETGAQETVYDSCIRTRANVLYDSGSRTEANGEIVFTRSVRFQIRRFPKFDETYRVQFEDRQYRILAIDRKRTEQMTVITAEIIEE